MYWLDSIRIAIEISSSETTWQQTEVHDDFEDEEEDKGSTRKLRVHAAASLRSPLVQQQTKVAASANCLPTTMPSQWLIGAVHCYLRVNMNKEIEELREAGRQEAAKQQQASELQLCIQVQGYVGAHW
ncbi:unnamed protein product [Symbiodinium natans]|uniref:Uncharacterized protein n=1 Tax=Symbiodinium natans TaxID=878477 RepID=A0A812T8Q5_9DINO|nr:unnamed protein product [Symbiodinium natans]